MKNKFYFLLCLLVLSLSAFSQRLTFSSGRGFYESSFQLTLSTDLAGATIRYTIDGSVPTSTTGTVYDQAIQINTTRVIRAIAYNGTTTTPVVTHSYLFLNDVLTQPATIEGWPNRNYALGSGTATATHDYEMDPNVVNNPDYSGLIKSGLTAIPTMSLVLNKDEFWDLYEGETTHPASVEIFYPDGSKEQFDSDLEAHSHNRLKRSLKLDINNLTVTNLIKQAPFNGPTTTTRFKDTKIVLRAGNNRSWARNWNPNRTCYTRDEWYRASQQAISGTGGRGSFVHLYVNGLYWGLYNPVERTDNGMLSNYFGGDYSDWMSLDHDGVRSGDASRFNYLTTTLINQDMTVAANFVQLKEYLDVSKFCDYLIVSWMMGMTDWPGNNFHGGNRNNPPAPFFYNAWDAEWSFDVTNGSNQGAWVHPEFRNTTSGNATIAKIWHAARRNPEFMQLFADRVYKHCFNNGALTDAASRARWAQINSYINTAIIAESARWGDAIKDGVTRTRDTHWTPEVNRVDGLMNGNVTRFINALVAQGYYPTLTAPTFNQEGGTVSSGFQVVLTNPNPAGTIYYTTDGSDPKTTDGAVAPGALPYTNAISLNTNQTIKTRVQNGTTWSALHEASFTVEGLITGLYINEFMASNTKKTDENGEFDDWIEIYNSTSQPIDIGGLYITDVLTNLTQWKIPATNPGLTTIPAKGYLLLWADGQPAQGPLHVTIKLSKGGEAIGLSQMVGSTPTLIDSYTFGAQKDDVSLGRFPDGSATFKEFFAPTPGSKNLIQFRSNLLINEFLAINQSSITDEAGEHDGWIEIYNNNNEAVDIGGMYMSKSYSNPSLWKIPTTNAAQTTIPAKGFLTLWADNQPAQGALHLGFTLDGGGGQLALTDIIGPDVAFSDSLSYGPQTADISRGRFPDAAKQGKFFSSPTPGAPNIVPPLSNLYINEFMASNSKKPDEFGEFDDWIEIYNNGTEAVDLGGLFITDDLNNPGKYQIPTTNPAQTTIPPKGFLLLWADEQPAQGVRHVSIKLSAGGEQIGLYQPNGTSFTLLDSYTFGAQTTDVSSGREQDGGPNFVTFTTPTPGASNVNLPPVARAGDDQIIVLPTNSIVLTGNTSNDPDGSIASYRWTRESGPNQASLTGSDTPSLTASGLVAGTYVFRLTVTDNQGTTASDDVTVTVNTAPVIPQSVVSLSLMNADNDTEIKLLTNGEQLNLATLPTKNLNIRANTSPATVGSVVMVLSGTQKRTQTETGAPYALFGDTNGDFKNWTPTVGSYGLTATPYTNAAGAGTVGTPLTLSFTVINKAPQVNRPPALITALADQNATVGQSFSVAFGATAFTDPDGDVLTYTASLEDNTALPAWLTFVGSTRTFSGTPPVGSPANITVKVTASDGKGGVANDSFIITITTPMVNQPPVLITALSDQTATVGQSFSLAFGETAFTDPDGDALTYTASLEDNTALPAWLTFVGSIHTFSGTPPVGSPASISVKVTASDGKGGVVSDSFVITITTPVVNHPPVLITALSDQTATVGQSFSLAFGATAFTDVDGDVLTYTASLEDNTALPAWLTFVGSTHTFSGTPPVGSPASISVKVTASDGKGGVVSDSFVITITTPVINHPPALATIGNRTLTLGQSLTFTAQATDSDVPAQSLSYSVTGPPSASINASTGAFSWTPTSTGTFSFTIKVTDNGTPALSDQNTISVTVNPAVPPQQSVVSLSLMNADNDTEIKLLTNGEQLNLATLPTKNLNIRANTSPATVGSVVMVLSGTQKRTQTETGAPYALFGDTNGDFKNWTPTVGDYSLTATPYTNASGAGTAGIALTRSFKVINQTPRARISTEGNTELDVTYYPTPFSDEFTLQVKDKKPGHLPLTIYNLYGQVVWQADGQAEQNIHLGKRVGPGVYVLQVGTGPQARHYKLVKVP